MRNMEYNKKDITAIVVGMKKNYKNIYKLSPAELAKFLKTRSNFIKLGITLSDEKLSLPDDVVVKYIMDSLYKQQCTEKPEQCEVHEGTLKTALDANVDTIDNDRIEIRKHLFNENIAVVVERVGRVFSTTWNTKMTTCKISVPSNWQIKVSQSLLLDIGEKDNKATNDYDYKIPDSGMSPLGDFMYRLLNRHSDYSIIKRLLEVEYDSPDNVLFKNVDRRKLNRLKNKGISEPVALSLLALVEQIQAKTFSAHTIKTLLGFRKRLVNEFDSLI